MFWLGVTYAFFWLGGLSEAGKTTKDCQWNGTVSALDTNCTNINAPSGLILNGTDDIKVLYKQFAHVTTVTGCIQISGTTYARFDFFARLRTINCSNSSFTVDFMASNNSMLERLGMPMVQISRLGLTFNPKLCITQSEAVRFTNVQRGQSDNITICQGVSGNLKECSSTINSANAGLEDNCEIITENLYVDGVNNANISQKLQYIKEVNGRIYVRATTLTNLTIPMLQKVYGAESSYNTVNDATIYVVGNSNFTTLDVPKVDFMAQNDYSFLTADASYKMDQSLCNRLSPFGSVQSNGTVCVSTGSKIGTTASMALGLLACYFLYH
ncbi:unnamed protein product [Caenorhabditis angaria]|uniref:Receptor L-domain domain-containing protein n=1 Tax=Caenorhabditis angaria TaxID=860376 RepID=A0A9P1J4Y1_9PELO|nr:unnamed protein product [Caenorhabditis angaria]